MAKEYDKVTLIEVYRPLLEECLIPSRIFLHIHFLTNSDLEQINNTENNKSCKEACKLFLDLLIHSGEPGWYEQLREGMRDNEYAYLLELLDGLENIKDERIPQAIMRNVGPLFVKNVKPLELLPFLLQHRVIDSSDENKIVTIHDNRGSTQAAFTLFLCVSCKSVDWFPKLAFALKETKFEYIIQPYIPDLKEAGTYEDVKGIIDRWLEKYILAEDPPRGNLASAAKEFHVSFDGTESEDTIPKTTGENVPEIETEPLVPQVDTKPLELRPYQEELVERALMGKNALMVAPTGSGKTHMALAVIKHHLVTEAVAGASSSPRRVAFFVPTRCLVWQQWKMCQDYLGELSSIGVTGATHPGEKVDLQEMLRQYQVIVMTPQILVDALKNNDVEHLGKFSLLIFDECHHAMKGHPYNDLMRNYRHENRQRVIRFSLPQVIGLTASVGVGKGINMYGARDHILRLCANLDCMVVQINRETESLNQYVNNPSDKTWEIKGRLHDPFYNEVSQIMQWIEAELQYSPETREVLEGSRTLDRNMLSPIGKHGTEPYKQWLSHLDLWISEIPSQKRRLLNTCYKHLRIYNDGLILNADCRAEDALDYISLKMSDMYPLTTERQRDRNDTRLLARFKEKEALLIQLSTKTACKNPKLDGLKLMITKLMGQSETSRGIVFCRTRVLSVCLALWASQDNDLKRMGVKAGRLTGARVAEEQGGMSQVEQDQVVRDFKKGLFRLLIATSVGQEGMDIPECNFVINYEHVTNEIARIQARGRGRAQDSQHITIGEVDGGTIQREKLNRMKENLMKEALSELTKMEEGLFLQQIKIIQEELSETEEGQNEAKRQPEKEKPLGVQIKCKNCNKFVCLAEHLRTIKQAHHVVIDPRIWEKVIEKPHKKPVLMNDIIMKTTKVNCAKCPQDWGIGAVYQDTKVVILKKGPALVYQKEESSVTRALREWKDLPFQILELTDEEFNHYRLNLQVCQTYLLKFY